MATVRVRKGSKKVGGRAAAQRKRRAPAKAAKPRKKGGARKVKTLVIRVAARKRPARRSSFLCDKCMSSLLVEIAGEKALEIAGELLAPMTDEDLAHATKIKISEVRAVMNKLHSARIASYSRTRNDEGWYTYTWVLCPDRAKEIITSRATKQASEHSAEDCGDFYSCPHCSVRGIRKFAFEKALEFDFRCPDCAEMLQYMEQQRG
jgi:transcription factor E